MCAGSDLKSKNHLSERQLSEMRRALRPFSHTQLGLRHEDGILVLDRDSFKEHYGTIVGIHTECGGWFNGLFDPGDGHYCLLRLKRANLFPQSTWDESSLGFPTARWFRSHRTCGIWHMHRSENPYSVGDALADFSVVVVRGAKLGTGEIPLCILSAVPFSTIVVGEFAMPLIDLDEVDARLRPDWQEIEPPIWRASGLKRFALKGAIAINGRGRLSACECGILQA